MHTTATSAQTVETQRNILGLSRSRVGAILNGALVLAIAFALLSRLFPVSDSAERLLDIPEQGIGFSSVELELDQAEINRVQSADVVKRMYVTGGQQFVLLAVDPSKNRHSVHDPLYCFSGSGWKIVKDSQVPMPNGAARFVRMKRSGHSAELIYWFSDGRSRHASVVQFWIQATLRRLTFGRSGPEPMMVCLQPKGHEQLEWGEIFQRMPFIQEI